MSRNAPPDDPEGGVGDHPVTFHPTDDGLAVVDHVEGDRYVVEGDRPLDPTADDADVLVPVDSVARVTAGTLAFPGAPAVYVRDADGELVGVPEPAEAEEVPAGDYYLEVEAPLKLCLRAAGPLTVEMTDEVTRVALDAPRPVAVGARSRHDRPAATVTTTADPRDVMAAVSTFGSALKTTSPERSFPTLRGHPPVVELGDELSVPDEVAPPETGVTVAVPPELEYVYPVAPLAHYLGAEVVPGDAPRLRTDAGLAHDLAPDGAFEREVERVLKGTFLLDCVVRTEGLYDLDLAAREQVAGALDRELDWAALYDQPLAERLATYLSVPHDALAPAVPDWKLAAHVEPTADAVESLPFLVDDLAVVHTADASAGEATADRSAAAEAQAAAVAGLVGGGSAAAGSAGAPEHLTDGDAMEVVWVGEGAPRGASKAVPAAFRNRLAREPATGDVVVTVVCNEDAMAGELDRLDGVYGGDAAVERREHLGTDELAALLAGETSFLHFVGHVEDGGFRCADGLLDARSLESVGVESFLLNGCTSYHQGLALVEAGAVGGVVTLADVVDDNAVGMGSTLARLLANGYPLRPSLEIARRAHRGAADYAVVGDGRVRVVRTDQGSLELYRLRRDGDAYVLRFVSYSNTKGGMGTMRWVKLDRPDRYYLGPGTLGEFPVDDADELLEFLHLPREAPVFVGDTLHWSTEFKKEHLPAADPS